MISLKIFLIINSNLGFNEATYKYGADGILEGKLPYKDFFDHKPPLIYYSLAFFFKIFGSSVQNMHILALIFDLALLILIFFIGKKLFNTEAALYSSALYSLLINFIYYDTEIPMAIFGLLGVFLYLYSLEKNKFLLLFSGIFLALSVWFKQPGILFFIAVLVHIIFLIYKKEMKLKDSIKKLYLIIAGALIVSLPLLSFFIYSVGFKTFFYNIITFNAEFSGSTSRLLQIGKFFKILISQLGILLAIIIFSFKTIIKEKYPHKNKLFIIISILILLFILSNKEIFFSHLIQLLPFVIFLTAFSLIIEKNRIRKLIILLLIFFMISQAFISLEYVARNVRGDVYEQQKIVVSYLNENVTGNIFSDSPMYYTLANKTCSYKVCFLAPSVASVFSFDDFCWFSETQDYLALTHRKKYLGEKNLACIENNFTMIKKFDNVDESYVEIWKKKI